MTTDVKLLPLPEHLVGWLTELGWQDRERAERAIRAYARANMEPLIAENDRLRAEVSELRVKSAMLERSVDASHETIKIGHRLHEALANEMQEAGVVVESSPLRVVNRRAERLAEALRWIASDETAAASTIHSGMDEVDAIKGRARAALDQEGGRE